MHLPSVSLIVLSITALPAWAQGTAAVSGRVEDASHGVVSGATVTVKSLETGAVRVVTTGENGAYRAASLMLREGATR